jgi:two-component system chemotaxis response regulator CheV
MQVAVFRLGDDNYYGMNINKINYFVITKEIELVKMYGAKYVLGYFRFNGKIIPLVNLCEWLHRDVDTSEFSRVIICEFSGTQMGFLVSDIYKIYDKVADELNEVSSMRNKVTYATKVDIDNVKDRMCMILDVENLYLEINPDLEDGKLHTLDDVKISYDKTILIAEDSAAIRKYIENVFAKFKINFILFNDGQKIIDYMEDNKDLMKNIDIVITDIEMPLKDGFQVIKFIKAAPYLSHVKVIVHTSMSNEFVNTKTKSLGADSFVKKMDPMDLLAHIRKYI